MIQRCSTCGKEFKYYGSHKPKYCGMACCRKGRAPPTRPCVVCGTHFKIYPSTKAYRCCSHACRTLYLKSKGDNCIRHPLHSVWWGMIARCDYKSSGSWNNYGGRGITYDPSWRSFNKFRDDMAPTWKKGLTLERRDVNGNYCKDNCCWVTPQSQANNKRINRKILFRGKTLTCAQWSRETGIHRDTILYRLDHGWSPEEILITQPNHSNRPHPNPLSFKKYTMTCKLCDQPYASSGYCKLHYFRWYNATIRGKQRAT